MTEKELDKLERTVKCVHCGEEYIYPKEMIKTLITPYECANCRYMIREIYGRRA